MVKKDNQISKFEKNVKRYFYWVLVSLLGIPFYLLITLGILAESYVIMIIGSILFGALMIVVTIALIY